jgi:hypothetical protein
MKVGDLKSMEAQTALVFDAQALGASFEEVAVDVIHGEATDFISRWFKSSKQDADLTIWVDGEKRFVKQQLAFYGQVVEWNPIQGTRTGLIVEEESIEVSEIIRFDKQVQKSAIRQAIAVLEHIRLLDQNEKDSLIFNLRESPRLSKNARERAIKTWALKLDEIVSDQRPTFWNRLRNWVLGG